jgi:hypothetical protein
MPDKTTVKQRGNSGNLRPFKKGQSGNPNGRPKKINTIPDILRKIGDEEGTADGKSKLDVIMYKVFQYALEGKPWAVQFIADRTEGKALERIEQKIQKDEVVIE